MKHQVGNNNRFGIQGYFNSFFSSGIDQVRQIPFFAGVTDTILFHVATQTNYYSSMHPYCFFSKGIQSQDQTLTKDILAGGCCLPHIDCVGTSYLVRHKIITTLKKFDEGSTVHIEAFTKHSYIEIGKRIGCFVYLLCG